MRTHLAASLAFLFLVFLVTGAEAQTSDPKANAIIRKGLREALVASMAASNACSGVVFNRAVADIDRRLLSEEDEQAMRSLAPEVASRFAAEPDKACDLAFTLYGPRGRSGFRFLYIARPSYADPRKEPPHGFIDGFDNN